MGQNQPKKLALNRETVRDLTKDELLGVEGAGHTGGKACVYTTDPSTLPGCDFCQVTC